MDIISLCGTEACPCVPFFYKQKTAYEMRISDWSSDVCSSDLLVRQRVLQAEDELHVRWRLQAAVLHHLGGGVEHGEVEDLAFRLDAVFDHRGGEAVDQLRRVLVDHVGKVHRAGEIGRAHV